MRRTSAPEVMQMWTGLSWIRSGLMW